MWYLRNVSSSCKQFGPVSTCLCHENTYKFIFISWEIVEKVMMDVD